MAVLFPTAYFPTIDYMAQLSRYDNIAIELHETFPKQTYRNRTAISTGNGILLLTVPTIRPQGNHTTTKDIEISHQEPWHIRHWRAIVSAYNSAPYFLYYRDGIEPILYQPWHHLVDLNDALLKHLLTVLKIRCSITHTQHYTPNSMHAHNNIVADYRANICSKHPQTYAEHPTYCQVFSSRYGFLPNLSILDLLFNLGPESKGYLQRIVEMT